MNALNLAIKAGLDSADNTTLTNKAYLEFIKANFIIPIELDSTDENPQVLFLVEGGKCLLPVFTEMDFFQVWAEPIQDDIKILKLSGVNLLKGIGDEVSLCLDIGSEFYKEFLPEEIARMRSMILKLFKD